MAEPRYRVIEVTPDITPGYFKVGWEASPITYREGKPGWYVRYPRGAEIIEAKDELDAWRLFNALYNEEQTDE